MSEREVVLSRDVVLRRRVRLPDQPGEARVGPFTHVDELYTTRVVTPAEETELLVTRDWMSARYGRNGRTFAAALLHHFEFFDGALYRQGDEGWEVHLLDYNARRGPYPCQVFLPALEAFRQLVAGGWSHGSVHLTACCP